MNTKNNTKSVKSVGRPAAELKFPRGIFTIKDLADLNPDVCRATVINHVESELDAKFLTRLAETVKTGKVGKPAHKFVRTSVFNLMKNRKKSSRKAVAPVAEVPAEVVAEPQVAVELAEVVTA